MTKTEKPLSDAGYKLWLCFELWKLGWDSKELQNTSNGIEKASQIEAIRRGLI